MGVIQLSGLTPDNAETVIARLWYVLEQRDIASPRIETRQEGGNRLAVQITFLTQHDADRVAVALQGLWSMLALVPGSTGGNNFN